MVSLAAVLAASSVLGLAACGGDDSGGRTDKNKFTTSNFYGRGDDNDVDVFGKLVKDFNAGIGAEK